MKKVTLGLAALVLWSAPSVRASPVHHDAPPADEDDDDNERFVSPKALWLVRPFIEIPNVELEIQKGDANGNDSNYDPNTKLHVGVEVSYGPYSVSLSYGVTDSDDVSEYGNTSYVDQGLSYYGKQWGFFGRYQSYKGFYTDDKAGTSTASTTPNSSPAAANAADSDSAGVVTHYPGLKLTNYEIGATYTVSPDSFSLAAAMDQSVIQLESGGSALAMVVAQDLRVTSDILLQGGLTRYSSVGVSVLGGYGYTLTKKKYFLTGTALLGVGEESIHEAVNGVTTNSWGSDYKFSSQIAVGRTTTKYLYGMTAFLLWTGTESHHLEVDFTSIPIDVFVGMRF